MPVSDHFKHTAGKAIGRIPSGVYILTAAHGGDSTAMMASWVQQAAFDPPAVSIALAKERAIGRLIAESGALALSVLPERDTMLMKRYARGIKLGEDPFAGVDTIPTPAGIPVLKQSLAWLECRVIETCDFGGDHDLIIAEVVAGELLQQGPAFAHQRGSGFHY
jgi:flavin reductase (DIM6/NTAB) family NADH-FMN oxidoreductase RutF